MVMDVEIVVFFHDLSLLLGDAENRNPGTDLLKLKEKCQQSIRTLHFILSFSFRVWNSMQSRKQKRWVAMTTFAIEKRKY